MRSAAIALTTLASIGIIAACADSDDPALPSAAPTPETVLDAGAPDILVPDADVPDTSLPTCSSAGWCITTFPDADLVFRDIWPFEERAFAIAESRVEGVKVLEWQKSTDAWQYIDDQTQNGVGVGTFAGRVYAPNENEVYFTVGPSFVYYGKRPLAPETKWTWTRQKLPDNVVGHPASHDHGNPYYGPTRGKQITLGVWGTGADDVYAYYSNSIFKRSSSDGAWTEAFVADDLDADDEDVFFTSVGGTGPNDVWFAGARDRTWYNCPLLVRKTAEGWDRVADGVLDNSSEPCSERPGTMRIGESGGGWLTDIHPVSATEYVALQDAQRLLVFDHTSVTHVHAADAGYASEQSVVPVKIAQESPIPVVTSMWPGKNESWFSSWGLVLRGADDGKYTVSTISRDGAPVDAPIYRIRGTSDQNLWAIGARYAYHKTTP